MGPFHAAKRVGKERARETEGALELKRENRSADDRAVFEPKTSGRVSKYPHSHSRVIFEKEKKKRDMVKVPSGAKKQANCNGAAPVRELRHPGIQGVR